MNSRGIERDIFHHTDDRLDIDQERASDLVTMSREAVEHDFFSRWLSDEVLDKFHSLIGRRFKVSLRKLIAFLNISDGMYSIPSTKKLAVSITIESSISEGSPTSSAASWHLSFQQPPFSRCTSSTGPWTGL
jgi:hypothetical protein